MILINAALLRLQTPISNIDQLVKQFEKTYDRTDQTTRNEYGDEQYRDRFTKHLEKMIVLTRTNIDEVVSSIEDAVTNSVPRLQYWCASTPQKTLFWVVNMLSLEVVDRLCTFRPPKKVVDFLQAINSSS